MKFIMNKPLLYQEMGVDTNVIRFSAALFEARKAIDSSNNRDILVAPG